MFRPNVSDELFKLMRTAETKGHVYPSTRKSAEGCRQLASMGVFDLYDAFPGSYQLTSAGTNFFYRVQALREKQKETA